MDNVYAKKMVDPKFYGLVNIKGSYDKDAGLIWAPYVSVCTYNVISDKDGTRKIRQVSRWFLLKLWFKKLTSRFEWNIHKY